jgi:hypothetical protein
LAKSGEIQELQYTFKNTQIKELKMEIHMFKEEGLRLRRMAKEALR